MTLNTRNFPHTNTDSECDSKGFCLALNTAGLFSSAVFSAVQKKLGEDLTLNVSVPEPVEVVYKGSDSADGEVICTVTQRSLQCPAEYTHRTSLSFPELTLRDVRLSDSGRYTIRDTENKEDIQIYAVSVEGTSQCGL